MDNKLSNSKKLISSEEDQDHAKPRVSLWFGMAMVIVAAGISTISLTFTIVIRSEIMDVQSRLTLLESNLLQDYQLSLFNDILEDGQEDLHRRTRRALWEDKRNDGIPIYEHSYKGSSKVNAGQLIHYNDLNKRQQQTKSSTTGIGILPHHRVKMDYVRNTIDFDDNAKVDDDNGARNRRRESHHKSAAKHTKTYKRHSRQPMTNRPSRVKMTSRKYEQSLNSVLPKVNTPVKVHQPLPKPQKLQLITNSKNKIRQTIQKKKTGPKKGNRRQQRRRTGMSVAHFHSLPPNTTQSTPYGAVEMNWRAANWMESLGLNRKYSLSNSGVTVKEAGLYLIYAQVSRDAQFNGGFDAESFTLEQDGILLSRCMVPAISPTCHTSLTTYLPQDAVVRVVNNQALSSSFIMNANSFFGLVKLMDAPRTSEELLIA